MDSPQVGPIASLVLLALFLYTFIELLWLTVFKKQSSFRHEFSQPLKNFPITIGAQVAVPLLTVVGLAVLGHELTALSLGNAWYVWPIALLIYEFWYWVQHYMAHKVRLLWCIHSPHHAPDTMNMLVGSNHHILELPYMAFFLGFVPALCGVPLEMILVISLVDNCWGSMLHASPKIINRRYGPLEYVLQTPSFHRAHHAQNTLYMDTNYNSITLFWDSLLGTRQVLSDKEPVIYGITRDVDVESWRDVQFGEFEQLWQDVKMAPRIANKLAYLFMPPGWSHTGDHKMASTQKKALSAQSLSVETR